MKVQKAMCPKSYARKRILSKRYKYTMKKVKAKVKYVQTVG